jgi:pimeloyl-ACP methyl ester carboxylesterase
VSAAVRLALACLLALPVFTATCSLISTTAFLVEFLDQGRWRPLSGLTRAPVERPLAAATAAGPMVIDLYVTPALRRPPGLVLVHGLSPAGKDDARLREAAVLLARSGWAVAVPTVDGLTVLRLRPDDAAAVSASVRALRAAGYPRVAVLGVSLGAGPALLAAADPAVAGSVSAVLALGGYARAVELLRYTLTGAYALGDLSGRAPVQEAAIAQFARANAELVDAAGARLVDNRDPAAFDRLVDALPRSTRDLLEALSPDRALAGLRAPLFLIHGRRDPAVPFTESLRLQAAARTAGRPVRAAIVGAVGHVEAGRRADDLGDLARLWATFYAFRRTAGG